MRGSSQDEEENCEFDIDGLNNQNYVNKEAVTFDQLAKKDKTFSDESLSKLGLDRTAYCNISSSIDNSMSQKNLTSLDSNSKKTKKSYHYKKGGAFYRNSL